MSTKPIMTLRATDGTEETFPATAAPFVDADDMVLVSPAVPPERAERFKGAVVLSAPVETFSGNCVLRHLPAGYASRAEWEEKYGALHWGG